MTDLVMLPDVEQLLRGFLVDQDEVLAYFLDEDVDRSKARIYTVLPDGAGSFTEPFARITMLDGNEVTSSARWLADTLLQVDVWGGSKRTARDAAETIASVVRQRITGAHDLGVAGNPRASVPRFVPDPDLLTDNGRARPRYVLTVQLLIHP